MTTLVTGAAPTTNLSPIVELLRNSGVKAAQPSQSAHHIDIDSWLSKMVPQHKGDVNENEIFLRLKQVKPGKLLEQALMDLCLSNWTQDCWGWADTRNIWLTDYLANYDDQFTFLLVFERPEIELCHLLASQCHQPPSQLKQLVKHGLAEWIAYNQEILRFYLRHVERCLLVQRSAAITQPGHLIQRLNEKFQLALPVVEDQTLEGTVSTLPALCQLIAQEELTKQPACQDLLEEILGVATLVETTSQPNVSPYAAVDLYRALAEFTQVDQSLSIAEQSAQAAILKMEAHRQQLTNVEVHLHQTVDQVQQLTRENNRLQAQENATGDLRESLTVSESQVTAVRKENDLLLLQLHETQEELEELFLREQQSAQQVSREKEEYLNLQKDKDSQIQAKAEKIEQLTVVQREQARLLKDQSEAINHSEMKLTEIKEEHDLLLVQLHQVQEELEYYFLQHRDQEKINQKLSNRLGRLSRRYADLIDAGKISVKSVKEENPCLEWTLDDALLAGQTFEQVRVHTRRHGEAVSLAVTLAERLDQPVREVLFPMKDLLSATTLAMESTTIQQLSSSDWQLLKTLSGGLAYLIQVRAREVENLFGSEAEWATWQQGFAGLRCLLAELPETLRYDSVNLMNEQVNPDYEHLWLQLENVSFGSQTWPTIEFRLGAANVSSGQFSTHPKLEFPEVAPDSILFEHWAPDLNDDFGAKMELRFELRSEAMDVAVWQGFSSRDQAVICQLLTHLPEHLQALQLEGISVQRPWADWVTFAEAVRKVMQLHLSKQKGLSETTVDTAAKGNEVVVADQEELDKVALETVSNHNSQQRFGLAPMAGFLGRMGLV